MLHDLQVLCFDLDDTLWDVRSVLSRAEQQVEDFLVSHYPALAQRCSRAEFHAARMSLAALHPERSHDMTWLRTETMRRLAIETGYPDRVGAEAFAVFIAARNQVELYPDVRPALERLGRRFHLATFSNGNADLGRIGLAPLFGVMLNAERAGYAKPHPEAFGAVAREIGCAPARMLYVGDDPHLDVAGARGAGFLTAWINRRAAPWPGAHPAADLEIGSLDDLEVALAGVAGLIPASR